MTRWQYHTVRLPDVRQGDTLLAELGADGWELVTVLPTDSGVRLAYLKRPVDLMAEATERSLRRQNYERERAEEGR